MTRERVKSSTLNKKYYLKGRAKVVRELDEFEVKMEVDESEVWAMLGKKIWSKRVDTRKDPASSVVRCRLCAEVNAGEPRCDTFAATLLFGVRATDLE